MEKSKALARRSLNAVLMRSNSKVTDEALVHYSVEERNLMFNKIIRGHKIPESQLARLVLGPGGFLSLEQRRSIWPKLLGVSSSKFNKKDLSKAKFTANLVKDASTIKNDVNRSFVHFVSSKFNTKSDLAKKREDLYDILVYLFHENEAFYYYQGYNDVVAIHMLVCGEQVAIQTMQQQSRYMLRDFHHQDMEQTIAMINLLYLLLDKVDPKLVGALRKSNVLPFFCLSWIITWFAHDLTDFETICRLYDAFIVLPPSFPIYTAAALMTYPKFRAKVFKLGKDSAGIHHYLQNLPNQAEKKEKGFSFDSLLQNAFVYMQRVSSEQLVAMSKGVNRDSVLFEQYPYKWRK